MFKINEKGPLERLRLLSVKLGGDFKEGHNTAVCELDNANGKGRIFTYEMMPGLSMSSYNIILGDDLNLRVGGGSRPPILMIYCLEGYFFHNSLEADGLQRVGRGRNVLFSPAENEMNTVTLPGKIKIKVCIIALEKSEIPSKNLIRRDGLRLILKDLYSKASAKGYFNDFGGARSKVHDYSKILIENRRTDVVGRLVTEAAILNMMAEQLDTHERSVSNSLELSPLDHRELERILIAVSDMKSSMDGRHTIKLFASRTALSPKKIQEGFRFFFGRSFANFLKDLRLEMARELLETTDLSISQVAGMVGISSKSHFSKIFQERFGLLPRNYRESLVNASRSFELSYRSNASILVGESDIRSIVEQANEKNKKIGVSGCLVYYEEQFFQILEGPKKTVLEVFDAIRIDPRHESVETLWKGPRDSRVFSDNGMFLLSDKEISLKVSTGRDLSADMSTLVAETAHFSVNSRMFWERIRNRILVSNVA